MNPLGIDEQLNQRYDIAISFLSVDESTAVALHDLLTPHQLKVFAYPRNQEDVVGRDGYMVFGETFRTRSRVVVLLHRKGWGLTKFTSVEEEAIKARHSEGDYRFDFLIAVRCDDSPLPGYIPPYRIYHSLVSGTVESLATVIANRAVEHGAELKQEDALAVAQRIAAERRKQENDEAFFMSAEGNEAVVRAAHDVLNEIQTRAQSIMQNVRIAISWFSNETNAQLETDTLTFRLRLSSKRRETEPRSFCVTRFSGLHPQDLHGALIRVVPTVRQLGIDEYDAALDNGGHLIWVRKGRPYSTEQLADQILRQLLEDSERIAARQRRRPGRP